MLVLVAVVAVVVADVNCDELEFVKFELSTIDGWLIEMTVDTAVAGGELKLDDVLIDLICCCCCWAAVAMKLGICVGIVAVGDEAIIDLIWVNAGDLAAIGSGSVCKSEGCCWGWWNGASGWWWGWCGKLATAAAAACDWDANK